MTSRNRISDVKLIELPKILDRRGNLSVVEENKDLPFDLKRVFWVYDVPGGKNRGSHAHRSLIQLIIAVSGSFSVKVDDGVSKEIFFLNHPYQGLLVPPGIWNTLEDFSSGAVCMVLCSDFYKEEDYIRNYREYVSYVKSLDR